jgi:hypothetical protein
MGAVEDVDPLHGPDDLWERVEARNRFVLERFPDGLLAARLSVKPGLRPVRFVRSRSRSGWFLLDPTVHDRRTLEYQGIDPGEFARCAAGEATSLEVRSFELPENWRPIAMMDGYDEHVEAERRIRERYPHVPPGHLGMPRS